MDYVQYYITIPLVLFSTVYGLKRLISAKRDDSEHDYMFSFRFTLPCIFTLGAIIGHLIGVFFAFGGPYLLLMMMVVGHLPSLLFIKNFLNADRGKEFLVDSYVGGALQAAGMLIIILNTELVKFTPLNVVGFFVILGGFFKIYFSVLR